MNKEFPITNKVIKNIIPIKSRSINIKDYYSENNESPVDAIGIVQYSDNCFDYLIIDEYLNISIAQGFNGELRERYYEKPSLNDL